MPAMIAALFEADGEAAAFDVVDPEPEPLLVAVLPGVVPVAVAAPFVGFAAVLCAGPLEPEAVPFKQLVLPPA